MLFERYDERISGINEVLNKHGIESLQEAKSVCSKYGIDCFKVIRDVQVIAFDDACWAYTVGVAIALKEMKSKVEDICSCIGEGLQSFAIKGSIADTRKVGVGHGAFAAKLLDKKTCNFAFVAGHESFAAAEGAIGVIRYANSFREKPMKVNLVGLGKPAARIISRYKGFTYVETNYDYQIGQIQIGKILSFGSNAVQCFGAHSVDEGVRILEYADIDTLITGNSTSHIKFTDPTVATYKKLASEKGKKVFCVASGGGTGRTMHPDNVAAGAASYGMTDTTGRMHSNLQFAGSSSVPAHVEMVGYIGMGNNPMVGATVSACCLVAKALS